MNDLATKWVEALRSGEYNQGKSQLRSRDNFCCLGVLCDISGSGTWEPDPNLDRYVFVTREGTSATKLPFFIAKAADIDSVIGGYDNILTRMNDSGKSFQEIADWIEEKF